MLGRKMRKKIEQLLATTAQNVQPDELSYKDILAQILYYGKDIKPEMQKFRKNGQKRKRKCSMK